MKHSLLIFFVLFSSVGCIAQYAPAANQTGTTAIHKDSFAIVAWANQVIDFNRGYQDIAVPSNGFANYGDSTAALGMAEGNSNDVISLGDGGFIVLGFPYPLKNRPGTDFAVFENSFSHDYLELAHVEVSSDGVNFVRLPSVSLTQTDTQIGGFGSLDPTKIYNLAGKYKQGYGTPFDLEDIVDSTGIDLDSVRFVKIIDVVGSINPSFGSYDSQGTIINDPYSTAFESGGFDLDAVGVVNTNSALHLQEQEKVILSVYPNPTKGQLYIDHPGNEGVELLDLSGRILKKWAAKTKKVDLNALGLQVGIYLVKSGDQMKRIVFN